MPLSENRELIQISTPAYRHLKKLSAIRKQRGLPHSMTGIVSELILSLPLLKSNGHKNSDETITDNGNKSVPAQEGKQ